MKTIAAEKFKDVCPKTMATRSLAGSVVREVGDPYGTGERWDADAS